MAPRPVRLRGDDRRTAPLAAHCPEDLRQAMQTTFMPPGRRSRLAIVFPFLTWLPFVDRATMRADFVAGLTGAIVVLPQGVAFAQTYWKPAADRSMWLSRQPGHRSTRIVVRQAPVATPHTSSSVPHGHSVTRP